MNITEKIIQKAAAYPAVAFDVFDTLIKRDVAKPVDVFRLGGEHFAKSRILAEAQARREHPKEITLAEIYAQPGMESFDPTQECRWETAMATPNIPVLKAVRILRSQGKHIYYISDMYLPPEQIASMLSKCGYEAFDGGFVSCSYGVQKRSGALFRRFLRETGLKANQTLFVGDSWRADVAGAALAGIRAWHLPTEQCEEESFPDSAIHAFLRNHGSQVKKPGERLGYSLLGVLEVAFCQWIHKQRARNPGGKIFFLARDMYLTREIYQYLYPEEDTFYLEVSRRSLCPLLLEQRRVSWLLAALPRQSLTGAQIAEYCEANCPASYASLHFDLRSQNDNGRLEELLNKLELRHTSGLALDYLHQCNLKEGDFLVDIGSGGTTQWLLQQLLDVQLYGIQLSKDERLYKRLPEKQVSVFLSMDASSASLYWAGQPMLERFISQDTGTTIGYFKRDGTIYPERGAQQPEEAIAQMQNGANLFAKDWKAGALSAFQIPADMAIRSFLDLVRNPKAWVLSFLGDICVEDGGIYPLASPQKRSYYFLHPRALPHDLAESRWKIGFLKRLFPVPLPFDRMYLRMKRHKER